MSQVIHLNHVYDLLKALLGDELGYLGKYEYLTNGVVVIEDWAIAILHHQPDSKLDWRMKTGSGIEAILEVGETPMMHLHHNNVAIGINCYKLTLIQHNLSDLDSLSLSVRKIYDIPSIKPINESVFLPSRIIDSGNKGSDNSFLPARAILKLKRNY